MGEPMPVAEDVAKFFIQYYDDNDVLITNLMLNKLLYFAQGHHLAEYGKPLFGETIEAWKYGPVVPSVYQKYKPYGKDPIHNDSRFYSTRGGQNSIIPGSLCFSWVTG